MINGDKRIKEFLNTSELNILYEIGISKNDNMNNAYEKLQEYIEKLGYKTLKDDLKKDEHKVYFDILDKICKLLPIY